ncbi:MAG: RNA methyltransferase [Chitinophagaceae bacterium]|nr:RNA methyltransferase [Chitinophagaceae bacterium]
MLSKNEVKYIQSLCHKKQRTAERLFIVEGVKLVQELITEGYPVKNIYATAQWTIPKGDYPVSIISEQELEKISSLQTPNQVLAIVQQPELADEPQWHHKLTLVLDGIQDPGNMGTIIRIADWFGIDQIIASEDTVELYNPKVIQSTMGSFIRVKVWYRDIASLLVKKEIPIYGAVLDGQSMYEIQPPNAGILMIGNESKGIREDLQSLIHHRITIPKIGQAESLNAAVALGILLSQFKRPH